MWKILAWLPIKSNHLSIFQGQMFFLLTSHTKTASASFPKFPIKVIRWIYWTFHSPSIKAEATISSSVFFYALHFTLPVIQPHSTQQRPSFQIPHPEFLSLFLLAHAHTAPLCPGTCPPAHPKWALCSLPSPLLLLFWSPILYMALIWLQTLPHHPSLITARTCKGFYAILHIV